MTATKLNTMRTAALWVVLIGGTTCTSKVKPMEPRDNLEELAGRSRTYYESAQGGQPRFPPDSSWTPPLSHLQAICKSSNIRDHHIGIKAPPEIWNISPWTDLGFSRGDAPLLFSYKYERIDNPEPGFRVRARGDVDCDGEVSEYVLEGRVVGSKVVVKPIQVRNQEYIEYPSRWSCDLF